jgi:ketol-acid reductoisomerase
MADEATLDLFTEQAFGPAFGRVLMTAVRALVEAGFPPEAVLLELYLSGELAYSFEKIREIGTLRQHELHSHTSRYGTVTRSGRYAGLEPILEEQMTRTIEEIRSGAFAREWSTDHEAKLGLLARVLELQGGLPITRWEAETRRAFRIGDAGERE